MNQKQAVSIINQAFEPIIGQVLAKKRISDILLGSLAEGGFLAPILLIGPPGFGKTRLMRVLKKLIKDLHPNRKTPYFESGKEMGAPLEFFEDVLMKHVHDSDSVLFVDEFHEAPAPMQGIIRSLIEVTVGREPKVVRKADYEVVFNPLRNGVVLGTNKIDVLDPALVSRFERIDLCLYSDEDMENILFQGLENDGITFNENTLRKVAECNRGSARDVVHWINAIRRHLSLQDRGAGKKTINKADVAEIVKKRETFPLGVSKNELNTLVLLEKCGPLQLKMLAARNLCSSKEQNANELYLFQRGLMTIDVVRKLTQAGIEYLNDLRADGFIPCLPAKS